MGEDIKFKIGEKIRQFENMDLYETAIELFEILGYESKKRFKLQPNTSDNFLEEFEINGKLNTEKASLQDWLSIDLLFQLTDEEMKQKNLSFFSQTLDRNSPASYLFFAIELKNESYCKTKLADISREMNKLFPMHVFILFKYGDRLTFSLIDRRQHKRIPDKEVLQKVTLVYNISITKPHAGHVHILSSFSLEEITKEAPKKKIQSFDDLQNGWRKVLSTEILNKRFYLEYQKLSRKLINKIYPEQIENKIKAHQGVLNLLNRIMFLYFLQKKEWIMKDSNFMIHFWKDYKEYRSENKKAIFHKDWLNTLFFTAFNGTAYKTPKIFEILPEPYKSQILHFPFLNGGLFTFNEDCDNFFLSNDSFEDIFEFFEKFIFTISENTPYDINLEINPELLGKMYEGMINATDLDDVEAEHGIIYTERPEINFMTRRSFVEVLWQKKDLSEFKLLSGLSREFFYHFIFDPIEQKKEILKRYKVNIKQLRDAITSLAACDPACGSGSMLLGVLELQVELIRAIDEFNGTPHSQKDVFLLKKQLISDCIYGVDIKEWAVRIAELRLWLYMISEAEFSPDELTQEPLLPNLDFKLRPGNSLIQKFGAIDFNIKELLANSRKRNVSTYRLSQFIEKKKKFIRNELQGASYDKLKREEVHVFIDLINQTIIAVEKELKALNKAAGDQKEIFIEDQYQLQTNDIFEKQRTDLVNEIKSLIDLKKYIQQQKRLPFSYDIDFMEIFLMRDDPGFDLVIGNPPYVRQEEILPPEDGEYLEYLLLPENKEEKAQVNKTYKEELSNKVYKTFPFLSTTVRTEIDGKNKTIPVYGNKVPGRSDLYVYFQLLCPTYLNSKGTFCFIISNSWLDVDYGSFIQQFILKHTKCYAVYDCDFRSFEAAVNTIIYLHSALKYTNPIDNQKINYKTLEPSKNIVHFVLNKIDYTNVSYAPMLIEQEHCKENSFCNFYRVIPLTQHQLYNIGYSDEDKKFVGDKWGGKYLRAPEIYYTILNKGKNKLIKLGGFAQILPGCYAGIADFFYVNENTIRKYGIESKYLIPLLRSSDNLDKLNFKCDSWYVISCHEKKNIISNGLRKYINWGEQQVTRKRQKTSAGIPWPKTETVKNRKPGWWSIPYNNLEKTNLFMQYVGSERFYCPFSSEEFVSDRCFHRIFYPDYLSLACSLNCSLTWLFINLMGRSNLGEGALKYEKNDALSLLVFDPSCLNNIHDIILKLGNRLPLPIYNELGFDKSKPIRDQQPNPLPDRKALDDVIFDELGLTQDERNEIYWSVAELVKQRLDKAASR